MKFGTATAVALSLSGALTLTARAPSRHARLAAGWG